MPDLASVSQRHEGGGGPPHGSLEGPVPDHDDANILSPRTERECVRSLRPWRAHRSELLSQASPDDAAFGQW